MSLRSVSAWPLAVLGALTLLTACMTDSSRSQVTPATAGHLAATPTPTVPAAKESVAADTSTDASGPFAADRSTARARFQSRPESTLAVTAKSRAGAASPTPLRLPIAEDLGPNYFELTASTLASSPESGPNNQIAAAVVAFGFSKRAKLRDERIEGDGPLAVVARISRHASAAAADRFAGAAAADGGLDLTATGGAANPLGLTAVLNRSSSSLHDTASGFTATRSLQTGWLGLLDGSRTEVVMEQWTAVRARTALRIILIWGSRITDGWGWTLVQRLVQTPAGRTIPDAR